MNELHRAGPARPAARHRRRVVLFLLSALLVLAAKSAEAYPFMLRHGYNGCVSCHVDPSGAGLLTDYGRAIGEQVLRSHYPGETESLGGFAWGMAKLPDWLSLGADLRGMSLTRTVQGADPTHEFILMRADALASVRFGGFVASGSLGYAERGALNAALTRDSAHNIVMREAWLGYSNDALFLRAGRMNLPFGIRGVEHTLWVRSYTRTDTNDAQQYGVAVAYNGETLRGELMGIVGNLQQRPDDYRERGYSGYLEFAPKETGLAVGASSLITHRELDARALVKAFHHVHGLFARYKTPFDPLILLSEWDYVLDSPDGFPRRSGLVGMLQADIEPLGGLHLMLTTELGNYGLEGTPLSYGNWASLVWFCLPQLDFRMDYVTQSYGSTRGRAAAEALLFQGHLYL